MNERVLVIDDEKQVLDANVRALRLEDIPTRGDVDPRRAIEGFRSEPTEVVVVDFHYNLTPDFTGLDVISEIQRINPRTKTILISGRIDHDKLNEQSLASELKARVKCDFYLTKTGERQKLVDIVKSALSDFERQSTDWKAIAEEHVSKRRVSAEEVRRVNRKIQRHIRESIDKVRGD